MAFKDLLKKFVPGEEIAEGVPEVSKLEEKKKKRTTPQDDAKRTRNSQVKIRLTEEEVAELKAAASAAGISLADFVMASAKNKPIVICKHIPGLLVELRRQGANLNQVVHLAQQTKVLNIWAVERAAESCEKTQIKIREFCEKWDVKTTPIKLRSENNGDRKN